MGKLKRGRPRKIKAEPQDKEQAEACFSEGSTSGNTTSEGQEQIQPAKADDAKAKKLHFKYDNIDKIREQQNARYEKMKG